MASPNKACAIYTPRPYATPEGDLNALVSAYRFILACHASKKASQPECSDESEDLEDDRSNTKSIPQ